MRTPKEVRQVLYSKSPFVGFYYNMDNTFVLYRIQGTVEQGSAQARRSGYPTANLALLELPDIPEGIYCAWTAIDEEVKRIPSVVFYGIPHSLPRAVEPRFEVHLFEQNRDLYGKTLNVELCVFIRENKKFEDFESLQEAIQDDIKKAKEYFNF
ncbi:riboflavin kinase [Candidatus Uhrbacteria bacterium]|nr:riboflavin kinase [Candidatus Uhrbacteria bacterium]